MLLQAKHLGNLAESRRIVKVSAWVSTSKGRVKTYRGNDCLKDISYHLVNIGTFKNTGNIFIVFNLVSKITLDLIGPSFYCVSNASNNNLTKCFGFF